MHRIQPAHLLADAIAGVRAVALSLVVCAVAYPAFLLLVGRAVMPGRAEGSLVRDRDGTVVGSRLIGQRFERDAYLWPRPSACNHDGGAASGSNLGPTHPALRDRVAEAARRLGATAAHPVPADLVTASGSGLDPHVTLAGALYQAERVSRARRIDRARVVEVIEAQAVRVPSGPSLVNVLEANLALDAALGQPPG